MKRAFAQHWPEYLMEGALLGTFMVAALLYTLILEYPGSPVHAALPSGLARHVAMGGLIGLTAIALIRSPWGQRSGAHFNPSTTLTFLRLGKIEPWDAAFYVLAQFVGAIVGTALVWILVGAPVADPSVGFIATLPGPAGTWIAFLAEVAIAFGLMFMVLATTNDPKLAPYTPYFVGLLVGTYILVEAPLSGMSLNPARSFAPALVGNVWRGLWIYLTAPLIGMLLGAQAHLAIHGAREVYCAKLLHTDGYRCIFICGYHIPEGTAASSMESASRDSRSNPTAHASAEPR